MSNITIPNLPSQSATTDLDLLVIVNSGETTTSKITITDFLNGRITPSVWEAGSGVNSVQSPSAPPSQPTGISAVAGPSTLGATGSYSVAFGQSAYATGYNSVVLGSSCQATGGYDFSHGRNNVNTGQYGAMIGGYSTNSNGYMSGTFIANDCEQLGSPSNRFIAVSHGSYNDANFGIIIGDGDISIKASGSTTSGTKITLINTKASNVAGTYNAVLQGEYNTIGSSYNHCVVIGVDNYTANKSNVVVVPGMVYPDYTNMDYADDTAAAAGGVVLGEVYHNSGAVRIRIA